MIDEHHLSQTNLVPIPYGMRLPGCDPLPVHNSAIDAIQILDMQLTALQQKLSVITTYARILPTILIQVNLREDPAYRIFTPEDDHIFTLRYMNDRIGLLDHKMPTDKVGNWCCYR